MQITSKPATVAAFANFVDKQIALAYSRLSLVSPEDEMTIAATKMAATLMLTLAGYGFAFMLLIALAKAWGTK